MTKVYVRLFSAINLGDDLFLKMLLERYPNTSFVLVADDYYNKIFKNYKNLTVCSDNLFKPKYRVITDKVKSIIIRNVFPKRYSALLKQELKNKYSEVFNKTDIFLSLGGSIFIQPKKLPTYADIEFYKLVNKNYKDAYYLGCNFGPYNDDKYKEEYEAIFSQAKDVCFRDEYSYALFSKLDNIRCRPDIIFGLKIPQYIKEDKTIGFSIISPRNGISKSKYIKKYTDLIKHYQNLGYNISLFSFCKKQGDEETIEEIIKLLSSQKNIKKVFYNGDIQGFLTSYASMQSMYCGRFHSMVLSMLFKQNVYPVIYSQKMSNVLKDIGYQGVSVKIEDFHKLNPKEISREIYYNKYNIEKEKIFSVEQFKELDLILK